MVAFESSRANLACRCGRIRGEISIPRAGRAIRVVCYCDDCQSYGRWLGGGILDPLGGTDILQTSPANVSITSGADSLACLRLSSRGLLRWYSACCRTAIGNTLARRALPFVGLVHSCIDGTNGASRPPMPVRYRVHGRYALGRPAGERIHPRIPFGYLAAMSVMIVGARLRGEHRLSPFFERRSGSPVAVPRILGC